MFIDEVDAIAMHRNENPHYDTYLELIRQMDGIEKSSNVFILAATNAPQNLDPAFTRSGRIDKTLEFTLPDLNTRVTLTERYILNRAKTLEYFVTKGNEKNIHFIAQEIAKKLPGYIASDIESIINLSFVAYHQLCDLQKDGDSYISKETFAYYPFIKIVGEKPIVRFKKENNRIDKMNMALRTFYMIVTEEIERSRVGDINKRVKEKKFNTEKNGNTCSATAVHEVGHAMVGNLLGQKTFESITIIPRGNALGYVMPANREFVTKTDYINYIKVFMGGRLAEQIVFGEDNISVGAVEDIRQATRLARKMVEQFGFSKEFGFMALSVTTGNYLGGKTSYNCSDQFREKVDTEVNELLKALYDEVFDMLSDKKELILKLAGIVFSKDTMTGPEFDAAVEKESKKSEE